MTKVLLPIPDRQWVPEAPKAGWCGETSIQMAALYYGAWLPQAFVHAESGVNHADIWIEDIAHTLDVLGMQYVQFDQKTTGDVYVASIQQHLDSSQPVIVGSKIYPSDHPHWNCDHIMLAVGYDDSRNLKLVINTNMADGQISRKVRRLLSARKGYSFINDQKEFYGFAVKGFLNAGKCPVSMTVTKEGFNMTAQVEATGLTVGENYVLRRDDLAGHMTLTPFAATATSRKWSVVLSSQQPARFTVGSPTR